MADTTEKKTDETATDEPKRYESEVENVGPCKIRVKVRVPADTVREELDARYKEIIKTVAFPGFRIGHAPRRLVEKKLGEEVHGDVREHVLTESFKAALDEHDLDPILDPEFEEIEDLELDPEKPLEYAATLLVRPTVEVPAYDTITVEKAKPDVKDEEIEDVIKNVRREHAVLEPVADGKLEAEGVAVVDGELLLEGEPLLDRENIEYHHPSPFVLGVRLKSLPEKILGAGTGDAIEVTERLPETWPVEDQAGKEVTAKLTVREIKHHVLPELDEEFVKSLDYDTVEEFRDDVRSQVERHAEQEAERETEKRIVDALIAATPFDIPEDIVKAETNRRIARVQAELRMQGASDEEVEEKVTEAKSSERAEVEHDFRAEFLLDTIARNEKILVTESEVQDRIGQMAAGYRRTQEEMEQYLEQRDMLGSIRSGMRKEKVMELLKSKVRIEVGE